MSLLDEIKRLRELAAKATPGSWDIKHHQGAGNLFRLDNPMSANEFMATSDFNLALIAASRTAIPTLCDALELSYKDNAILIQRYGELCDKLEKAVETLRQIEEAPEASWEAYGIRIKARALLKEWGIE